MNKAELIAAVAEKADLANLVAEAAQKDRILKRDIDMITGEVLDAFTGVVSEALAKGDKVQMVGFGTFETTSREARTARNPRTRETVEVAASRTPRFKAGKSLKDAVNR